MASTSPIGFWMLNDHEDQPNDDQGVTGLDAAPSGTVLLDEAFPASSIKSVHLSGSYKIVVANEGGKLSSDSFSLLLYIKPDAPPDQLATVFGFEGTVGFPF
jgi:hypothetical protein